MENIAMVQKKQPRSTQLISLFLNNKALVILITITVICSVVSPYFLSSQNLMNIIRQVTASAVIGIGFTCVIASGNLDLSVGYMVGLLGVVMGLLSKTSMPFIFVVLIGITLGVFCGLINGFIGVAFGLPLFIVTLATGQIFRGACYLFSNAAPVVGLNETFRTIGQGYWGPIPIPVCIMLAVLVIIYFLLNKTVFGRHSIATGGNREAARIAGINVKKTTLLVYALMGTCAAVAAMILTGRAASAQPIAGQGMEMDAIAAVVIGGTPLSGGSGKVVGTLFGCLLVGVINNILNLVNVDSSWQMVAKGVMILFAVLLDVLSSKYFSSKLKKV